MRSTILCLLMAGCVIAAQGQTTMSRLVGATDHILNTSATMTPTDSTAYFFTGDNGGDLTHKLKYTTDTTWADSSSGYAPLSVENQTFDDSNNISSITVLTYNSGVWTNSAMQANTYDGSNNLTGYVIQHWSTGSSAWVNNNKVDYTYDAANSLTSATFSNWDAGTSAWVPTSRNVLTLNSSELAQTELTQTWNTGSSAWQNQTYDTFTYDGSGNMITLLRSTWTGTAWMNSGKHVHTYDGSNFPLTDTSYVASVTSGWMYYQLTVDSNDVTGLELNNVIFNWIPSGSRFLPNLRTQLTYNSYSQITSTITLGYGNTGHWTFGPANDYYLYYYQPYTSHVGTPIVNVKDLKLTVSPNPTADYVRIQMQQEDANPLDVKVYDMHGRLVRSLHETGTMSYNRTLPVHDWAAGSYVVVVNTGGRSITRQFVVTH